jgi:hypothetical protein
MHKMHKQKGWVIWCPYLLHEIFEIWPFLTLNWRCLPRLVEKQPSWITTSQPPLVATSNWCGEKCVAKASWKWKHRMQLMIRYNVSPTIMWWTPPKSLIMAKRLVVLRICAILGGMWPYAIWKKSWNN